MIRATASTVISRTPQQVFEFISDIRSNYQRWSPEVIKLDVYSNGPIRVGTTAKQVRIDQGRRTESVFRVCAYKPGERLDFQGTSNPFRASYKLVPESFQTRLTFTFELSRIEFFMRPFEKLIRLAVQDGADKVVRNIRQLVESEFPAEPIKLQ